MKIVAAFPYHNGLVVVTDLGDIYAQSDLTGRWELWTKGPIHLTSDTATGAGSTLPAQKP